MSTLAVSQLACWLALLIPSTVQGARFPYLGCFADNASAPIMTNSPWGSTLVGTAPEGPTQCLMGCRMQGFPFAALRQGGFRCTCGNDYSLHGPSADCMSGCFWNEVGINECGGAEAMSVYYTVELGSSHCPNGSVLAKRWPRDSCLRLAVGPGVDFWSAREDCVKNNADLVVLNDLDIVKAIQDQVSSLVYKPVFWFGLYKPHPGESFMWSSPYEEPYNPGAYGRKWEVGHPKERRCAVYTSFDDEWETRTCDRQTHVPGYICQMQLTSSTKYRPGLLGFFDRLNEFYSSGTHLALALVLPLMISIAFSCCLCYWVPRCRRRCRRHYRRRHHRRFENEPPVDPKDVTFKPPPEDVYKPRPDDVIYKPRPNDVIYTPRPNDVIYKPRPEDITYKPRSARKTQDLDAARYESVEDFKF